MKNKIGRTRYHYTRISNVKILSASNTDDAPENKRFFFIEIKCGHDAYKFQKHTIFKCY